MLGKVLVGLLVAAGAFLVYSIFAGGTANASEGGSAGSTNPNDPSFNKWLEHPPTATSTYANQDDYNKAYAAAAARNPAFASAVQYSIANNKLKWGTGPLTPGAFKAPLNFK